jgi:flagellar hook assembly protein FlgD
VRAELFDATGRRVRTLWNGELAAGTHRIRWNGRGADGRPVAAGRYWARAVAGADQATRSLTLLP